MAEELYFPRVARGVRSYPTPSGRTGERRLGLGVLGLGEGRTALVAADRTRHVRAVAACDASPDVVATVRRDVPEVDYSTDYTEVLGRDDVDIVAIYTPDRLHGEHVVAAFEAGKDVVCTKPLVTTVDDARAVLTAAERTGRKLLVGQSTRFFESFQRQRQAFERGEVGTLDLVEAHYTHRMDWYYAKAPWAKDSSDWVSLGLSHPLDLLRWYLGPIQTVTAFGRRSRLAREVRAVSDDIHVVNAVSADGQLGRAMGHFAAHELPRARNAIECVLYGSDGTSLAQYHDMRYVHTAPDGTEIVEDMLYERRHYYFNNEVHGMHYGEFANYLDHFAAAILAGSAYSPDLREGLETFCLMEAVRISSREGGRPVALAPLLADVGL
jgi:predicted dehydrogenase